MHMSKSAFFVFFALSLAAAAVSAAPWKNPQAGDNAIPYGNVSEALTALKSKPGVTIHVKRQKELLITEADQRTHWSFTAADHPAHPAVVRRIVRSGSDDRGGVSILCDESSVHCERFLAVHKTIYDLAGIPIVAPKPQVSAATQ
ncbi:MAG TPA: hypothetical protein VLC92_08035 [Rhodocyclaceae bacterium]|nr:hypothetical protein [Rhodocyclaceae bacterium]